MAQDHTDRQLQLLFPAASRFLHIVRRSKCYCFSIFRFSGASHLLLLVALIRLVFLYSLLIK